MTDTQSELGAQETLVPEEPRDTPDRGDWERALSHAHIAHEGRPWEVVQSNSDIPEDVAYEHLVSWLTNFLGVVDHAYEWGYFDA